MEPTPAITVTPDDALLEAAFDARIAAGESITLGNASTSFSATALTNAQGRARFSAVPAADGYEILSASQSLATGLRLRANEARAVAVKLALQSVLVTGRRDLTAADAINAEVSAGFSGRELQALPVEARDLAHALVRLPNVVASTGFFPEAPGISINGANGLFAQYLVDGLDNNENFLGGPKFPVPIGLVQDVTVLAASYSAEYGRTGNGVVNVTTRSGTNDWRGEGFYLMRPGASLDSASPFAGRDLSGNAVKDGFRRDQAGVAFGGPIVRDETFVFVDAEYTRDEKDNLLSSPALGVNDTVAGTNRTALLSAKIDHELSDHWRLALRANHGVASIERQGGGLEGGVTFPSAGSVQDRVSTLTSFSAIYDAGGFTSESAMGYSRFRWNYGRALGNAGPQVTINAPDGLAAAVLGNPGFVFDELENSWQWQQKLTLTRGAHSIKLGADLLHSAFELSGGGNQQGNYTVRLTQAELDQVRALNRGTALDIGDIPATAQVENYSVELRPGRFGSTQDQTALYAEDQMSLTARLTATFGLRWDYDSLSRAGAGSGDRNNFAPRLALSFRVRPTLALRAGAGRFYEKIPYTVASDALQQNTTSTAFRSQLQQLIEGDALPAGTNLERVTFDGNLSVSPTCTAYLQCPTPATSQGLRDTAFSNERRILNPNGLDNPYTNQFSIGLQWEAFPGVVAGADVIYANGYNLLRLRDLNAPAPFSPNLQNLTDSNIALLRAQPSDADRRSLAESLGLVRSQAAADATRPVGVPPGGAREIVVSETGGRSRYRALTLRAAKETGESRYGYIVSYTLSKLTNDTDDINFRSANSNSFGTEWGPSVNDRRHVVSAVFFAHPLPDVTLSVAGLLQSGQPINYIPDATIFGTTDLNGDGASFSDAYLGNSDRAPGVSRNSGRLPWSKTIDLGVRYAPAVGDARVELAVDVFNLFNHTNLSGFANSATQSNQIQVSGAPFVERNGAPPRQFQFGVRYLF
ncbi:MAG: TonB-dependent receptor [Gammaproteobacteria bacterium]